MKLKRISYAQLNARQKENFNFQKVSAVLAEYGFVTFRLSDDWQGADFVALHISGEVLRVQLKSRLAFARAYEGKNLHIAFAVGETWYLYPHDEVLAKILAGKIVGDTRSWRLRGRYSFHTISKELRRLLEPYQITGDTKPLPVADDENTGTKTEFGKAKKKQ